MGKGLSFAFHNEKQVLKLQKQLWLIIFHLTSNFENYFSRNRLHKKCLSHENYTNGLMGIVTMGVHKRIVLLSQAWKQPKL